MVIRQTCYFGKLICCIYLRFKNNSIKNYAHAKNAKALALNYDFGLLAGVLWFSQFIIYGMGQSKMGGFVFNTVHNILPDVPPENIVAMFDAINEFHNR